MNGPNRRLHTLLSATLLTTALTTTGCHVYDPYPPTPPDAAAQALKELQELPSFEETRIAVQQAVDEITAAATRLIAGISWETPQEGSAGTCQQPYEQTGGRVYYLPHRVAADVTVSEQDWRRIQQAAAIAAAGLGATEIQVMQDGPGNHDVGYYGPAGVFVKVGYRGNLVVTGYTGCRLPRQGG